MEDMSQQFVKEVILFILFPNLKNNSLFDANMHVRFVIYSKFCSSDYI